MLDMLARAKGKASVTGSERTESDWHTARQVSSMLLERVEIVESDGIAALHAKPEGFDIIFAHMFGPSYYDDFLASEFIPAALRALRAAGVILINSDADTMANVQSWTEENVPAQQVAVIDPMELSSGFPSGLLHLPHIVIRK